MIFMPQISVIIPCLNMELYILNCLNSIIKQSLEDLEILVIDAGSLDGTIDIVKELMEKDKRIRLISSDRKSYGYQVNLGISLARGEYIAIVDADDRIAPDMYKVLYENAGNSGADYVKGTAKLFYTITDNFIYYRPLMQLDKEEYSGGKLCLVPEDRPDLLTKDNFLWYGIYKQEFIKNIRLHESPGAAFQDLGGLLQTQMKARNAVYLEEAFYEYRQDNVAASGYNPKGFEFIWNEYIWAERFIQNASEKWKRAFYKKFFLHTIDRYYAMSTSGEFWKDAEIYISKIREKLGNSIVERKIELDLCPDDKIEDLRLFLTGSHGLFDKYRALYMKKKKQTACITEFVKGREVIIFGCGQLGRFIHAVLIQNKICNVAGYCDNSRNLYGKKIQGITVLSPDNAVWLYSEACFIIANKGHSEKIKKQLIELGIPERQICCYTVGTDMRLLGERFA